MTVTHWEHFSLQVGWVSFSWKRNQKIKMKNEKKQELHEPCRIIEVLCSQATKYTVTHLGHVTASYF